MPVITQKWIKRSDLQSNPDVLYLFGDNNARVGYGGQAAEMRDEPNAIGIATKTDPGTFWSEQTTAELDKHGFSILEDLRPAFEAARAGRIVVVPEDGLGTGLSELPQRCPALYQFLTEQLAILKSL